MRAILQPPKSGALGRKDLGYLKGSIGWVIEKFLASDVGFGKLKLGTQRNYRRWLDTIKAEIGQFQINNQHQAEICADHGRRLHNGGQRLVAIRH